MCKASATPSAIIYEHSGQEAGGLAGSQVFLGGALLVGALLVGTLLVGALLVGALLGLESAEPIVAIT